MNMFFSVIISIPCLANFLVFRTRRLKFKGHFSIGRHQLTRSVLCVISLTIFLTITITCLSNLLVSCTRCGLFLSARCLFGLVSSLVELVVYW